MADNNVPRPGSSSWAEAMRAAGPYLHVGWVLVLTILLGVLIGRWIDARWGTEPAFLLVGAILGIVLGLYYFLSTVLKK